MADSDKKDDKAPIIIIKKVKKVAGGHHGGAWKVAYADFVTAMMAFFLLMWLLGMTDEVTKKGLAQYFAPRVISGSSSGAGGLLGGQVISEEGARNDDEDELDENKRIEVDERSGEEKIKTLDKEDEESFRETMEDIADEIAKNETLEKLKESLVIDMTHEGLRIQLIDREGKPMFKAGRSTPMPHTIKFIQAITDVIRALPNEISLRGHTDASSYRGDATYTNWELSADRANATRRIMRHAEFPLNQFKDIQGRADRDLFDALNPLAIGNRRVTIMVLKQSQSVRDKMAQDTFKKRKKKKRTIEKKKREEGVIYFP